MSEKMRDGFESWCLANGYTLRPAETDARRFIEKQRELEDLIKGLSL